MAKIIVSREVIPAIRNRLGPTLLMHSGVKVMWSEPLEVEDDHTAMTFMRETKGLAVVSSFTEAEDIECLGDWVLLGFRCYFVAERGPAL